MKNDKLKEIRQSLNLSQKDFADKLGIQQSYYSALELGKKDISTSKVLQLLFEKIGVRPDWYYNSIGNIFNNSESQNKRGIDGVDNIEKRKIPNYSYLFKFRQSLKETHPELDGLSNDLVAILSIGDIVDALHDTKLGDPIFFGVDNLKKVSSFKEFKIIGNQVFSEAYKYKDIIHEFAMACRKFATELNQIKDEIELDFDIDDWLE